MENAPQLLLRDATPPLLCPKFLIFSGHWQNICPIWAPTDPRHREEPDREIPERREDGCRARDTSARGVNQITAELQRASLYLGGGWDLAGESANGVEDTWDIAYDHAVNNGYPHLAWQNQDRPRLVEPTFGAGTEGDPYVIESLEDLHWLSQMSTAWDKHFLQRVNIDASATSHWNGGAGFWPIGFSGLPFTGVYDGGNRVIANLFISRNAAESVGFFASTATATIRDLGLHDAWVEGGTLMTGALVATLSDGTVIRCSATGSLRGGSGIVGGLVGIATGGSISESFSRVELVAEANYTGGLAGYVNDSTVRNCHSAGFVSPATVSDGGLIGLQAVSIFETSFWDTETSGQPQSAGGTGKTTAAMKSAATFLDAGWDFSASTVNGTADLWGLAAVENDGYPFLVGQGIGQEEAPAGTGEFDDPYQIENVRHLPLVVSAPVGVEQRVRADGRYRRFGYRLLERGRRLASPRHGRPTVFRFLSWQRLSHFWPHHQPSGREPRRLHRLCRKRPGGEVGSGGCPGLRRRPCGSARRILRRLRETVLRHRHHSRPKQDRRPDWFHHRQFHQ